MTLKYLGIHPEHEYTGRKYERHLHHTDLIKGRMVSYYEVIELEEMNAPSSSSLEEYDKLIRSIY